MTPEQLERRIEELVAEEQDILARESEDGPSEVDHERLQVIKIALDELWDLQRRQRASSESGGDPAAVELRDAAIVEGYEQ